MNSISVLNFVRLPATVLGFSKNDLIYSDLRVLHFDLFRQNAFWGDQSKSFIMYIKAITGNPSQLISAIDKAMTADELKTWALVKSKEGEIYYTHTPGDWNRKAIIGRQINEGNVIFTITHWSDVPKPSLDVEGYYFGRFTEVLLVHFRVYFTKLETGI